VQFTLWYLRGKKFIEVLDDGVAITVAGVDHAEALGVDRDPPPSLSTIPSHAVLPEPRGR
jgi:hypothetical protein